MLKISAVAAAVGGVLATVLIKGENPYSHGWLDFGMFLLFVAWFALLVFPSDGRTRKRTQLAEKWGRALGNTLRKVRRR